ncbi:MAG: hypothetical protein HYY84_12850 [Deltaproteobacteria bacterium]|nr:hypothetical protein [Deltaproteobacteria bacterium]
MEATVYSVYGGREDRHLTISYNFERQVVECDDWFLWSFHQGDEFELRCALSGERFAPRDGLLYVILVPLLGACGGISSTTQIRRDDELAPLVWEADAIIVGTLKQLGRADAGKYGPGTLRTVLIPWAAEIEARFSR